ncbi:hypothetical protein GCM10010967_57220 [Dyadobacter beijingensis]|uniref:Uncharacterized protein n=1 Tax=Dyadobacter beijingensis TaxID=365489 RepID=A0ABQ2IP86_9BACT|nr:hypothetical protein GCM10010967_57220 [Dyadobacter beijingensis]
MDENVGNTLLAFLEGIDTIFYGRVSYDLWGQYQPTQDACCNMSYQYPSYLIIFI